MKDFTQSFGFIVFFLVMTLGLSLIFGEKATSAFLVLILVGMVFTNTDKIIDLMGRFDNP